MITLRNRFLNSLVLAAVLLSALGIGVASARTRDWREYRWTRTTLTSKARPVSPYSGEPDAGSGTAPKTTSNPPLGASPVGISPVFTAVAGDWITRFWTVWLATRM